MEKIKKALEKAREGNGDILKPKSQSVREAAETQFLDVGVSGIKYSQTRQVVSDESELIRNRVISSLENAAAAMSYKLLRTQVEQRLSSNGWNALAITSPGAAQGKTTTAINLAISLAYEVHRTVLLVDLDLRNPCIHRIFDFGNELGILDYLQKDEPLSKILINPGIERLVILPGTKSIPNSSELLASPKMMHLVDELKNRYPSRFVIFDLPPVLSADDALAFSPYIDAALIVVEDGETTKDDLSRSLELLKNTEILGTVLNKSDSPQDLYYGT